MPHYFLPRVLIIVAQTNRFHDADCMCIYRPYVIEIYVRTMHLSTVEPHLTVTSLVRKPPNYSHPGSVPNYIPQCKLPPCNMVTSPLRSLLPSPVRDLNSEVPLYTDKMANFQLKWLFPRVLRAGKQTNNTSGSFFFPCGS